MYTTSGLAMYFNANVWVVKKMNAMKFILILEDGKYTAEIRTSLPSDNV
jgi:hypothetical protein